MKVYIASPLGFSETTRAFYNDTVIPKLVEAGITVLDPWENTTEEEIAKAMSGTTVDQANLRYEIGKRNALGILKADMVLACLDGQDVDSGTASEIGLAYGLGKPIVGWRSDFRKAGELGGDINLQVAYFIVASGGTIYDTFEKALLYIMFCESIEVYL